MWERVGERMWERGIAYQVCSNNDPRLPLTYLTSNLLPNAFKQDFFLKLII